MLKIIDSVDLKEIGCDISEDEFDQIWSYGELLFDKDTRIIDETQFNYCDMWLLKKRLNDLYDLIKANLVENVEDKGE